MPYDVYYFMNGNPKFKYMLKLDDVIIASVSIELEMIGSGYQYARFSDLYVNRGFRGEGYAKEIVQRIVEDFGDTTIILKLNPIEETERKRLRMFYGKFKFESMLNNHMIRVGKDERWPIF